MRAKSAAWVRYALVFLAAIGLVASLAAQTLANGLHNAPLSVRLVPLVGSANSIPAHFGRTSRVMRTNPLCAARASALSAGALLYCNGPQFGRMRPNFARRAASVSSNVDMANPAEDISPQGLRANGQSEVSIAALNDGKVLGAWNDASGFINVCGAPNFKDQLSGYGYSTDGGRTFIDEGGLPNVNCNSYSWFGDAGVENWTVGGTDYAYVTGLFENIDATDLKTYIAVAACQESAGFIACGQPTIVTTSSQCNTFFCSFLDKPFPSIDPVRGRLYVSYTEFGAVSPDTGNGDIDLAYCDIGTKIGGIGPLGGTAGTPVCNPGGTASAQSLPRPPYGVLASSTTCEQAGSYPAVDVASGDVYVAYEYNRPLFFEARACRNQPTEDVVTRTPLKCLAVMGDSCAGPSDANALAIFPISFTGIAGYNRFPSNDFPRIAVSAPYRTVSIAWNDVRSHPLGDILLESFSAGSLNNIQLAPVQLDNDRGGGLHFLPMLRNAEGDGKLTVGWFRRVSGNTADTDVYAATDISPLLSATPGNRRITTVASNWLVTSSDIIPNFGDYNDNYAVAKAGWPYTAETTYFGWSDGRLGIPNPFEAHE
ncbi:MAG: hypothetical protein M3Z37_04140 [Candidatus Eremiobacteraeota bacterium]|nr:hypothetical protein [Candidatus Eremiobacteraeota bacterium]